MECIISPVREVQNILIEAAVREQHESLEPPLNLLTVAQRPVYKCVRLEGLTHSQTAKKLRKSQQAVSKMMKNINRRLKAHNLS